MDIIETYEAKHHEEMDSKGKMHFIDSIVFGEKLNDDPKQAEIFSG